VRKDRGDDQSLPVPQTKDEQTKQHEILRAGAKKAELGALAYLKEQEPAVYKGLVSAGARWAEEKIKTGDAVFRVRRPMDGKRFHEWLLGPQLIPFHIALESYFNGVFNTPLANDRVRRDHFVSRKGRWGDKQQAGLTRVRDEAEKRAAAVLDVGDMLHRTQNPARSVTDEQARSWVRQYRTPATLSLRIISHFCDRTPREMESILNKARKQVQGTREDEHNLMQRGWHRPRARDTSTVKPGSMDRFSPVTPSLVR
jgi:hypothetical protein